MEREERRLPFPQKRECGGRNRPDLRGGGVQKTPGADELRGHRGDVEILRAGTYGGRGGLGGGWLG